MKESKKYLIWSLFTLFIMFLTLIASIIIVVLNAPLYLSIINIIICYLGLLIVYLLGELRVKSKIIEGQEKIIELYKKNYQEEDSK